MPFIGLISLNSEKRIDRFEQNFYGVCDCPGMVWKKGRVPSIEQNQGNIRLYKYTATPFNKLNNRIIYEDVSLTYIFINNLQA